MEKIRVNQIEDVPNDDQAGEGRSQVCHWMLVCKHHWRGPF